MAKRGGGGSCMAKGGMHGKGGHAWQGGMHSRGACMAGGHAWQGACVAGGVCITGETTTAVDGTHPTASTGMHSCLILRTVIFSLNRLRTLRFELLL